jgi:hypothetical protein
MRFVDELAELPVSHRRAVDPETVDGDAMDRRFFGIMYIRSHAERAAGNKYHIQMRERVCLPRIRRQPDVAHGLLA